MKLPRRPSGPIVRIVLDLVRRYQAEMELAIADRTLARIAEVNRLTSVKSLIDTRRRPAEEDPEQPAPSVAAGAFGTQSEICRSDPHFDPQRRRRTQTHRSHRGRRCRKVHGDAQRSPGASPAPTCRSHWEPLASFRSASANHGDGGSRPAPIPGPDYGSGGLIGSKRYTVRTGVTALFLTQVCPKCGHGDAG